jgi:hypothetical protein
MARTRSSVKREENTTMKKIIYIRNTNKTGREGEDALLRWLDVNPDKLTEELRQRVLREVWKFFDDLFDGQIKKTGGSANEQ